MNTANKPAAFTANVYSAGTTFVAACDTLDDAIDFVGTVSDNSTRIPAAQVIDAAGHVVFNQDGGPRFDALAFYGVEDFCY